MFKTYQQWRALNDGKPTCRYCFVTCNPKSREYRALQVCQYCYDDVPLITKPKELLPCRTR